MGRPFSIGSEYVEVILMAEITGYGYVLKKVLEADISRNAKLLYCMIAVFADSEKWLAHPQTKLLCGYLKITDKTLRRARGELSDLGYLQYKRQGTQVSYDLTVNHVITSENGVHTGYGYLPKSIILDNRLANNSKLLYAFLASYAGTAGKAWPSIDKITKSLGMYGEAFYDARLSLVAGGLIKVTHRFNGKTNQTNVYTLKENQRIIGNETELSPWYEVDWHQDAFRNYELAYGEKLTVQQRDLLSPYVEKYGDSWVNSAIQLARNFGHRFNYALSIMQKWDKIGLSDFESIIDWQKNFLKGEGSGYSETRANSYLIDILGIAG